jgi:protein-S-isoprenylcysteine O-methyltransferase Ste14
MMSTLAFYSISLFILIVASIVILRIFVRRDYMQRGCLSAITAVLQACLFFLYGGYPAVYLPPDWPVSHVCFPIQAFGWICITLGLAVLLIGMSRLGILQSLGLRVKVMKRSDFYSYSRNPQVIGCAIYVLGFVILWPSVLALGWAAALIIILHIMVLTEEEHLLKTFNEDYERYCNRIPRYIGFPGKSG